jgi:predicted nicotinamide N-methyase
VTGGERREFIRARTAPCAVPLVPELSLYQASQLTPLWHATAAELAGADPAPFWAFPWAGGQALARYLLDHPALVRGRCVFDFATGSGLVAIAAARAGARRVVASDHDDFCQAAVELNARRNGVEVAFRAGEVLGEPLQDVDVVLAGDVFYEAALSARTLAWFGELARRGARALVGDPGRIYSPAGLAELASYLVPTSLEIESGPSLRARVLEVPPSSPP